MTIAPMAPANPSFGELLRFAELVAGSDLVPRAYRNQPPAIVIAAMLGHNMGLSWAESLYRIHIIDGKPSASAELIASNVRKAGHRLRVETEPGKVRVTIVRRDDPEFTFESVWDMDRAHRAQLTGKTNYQRFPEAMLTARAITDCARRACPDALYGVVYDMAELDDATRPNGPQNAAGTAPIERAPAPERKAVGAAPALSADAFREAASRAGSDVPPPDTGVGAADSPSARSPLTTDNDSPALFDTPDSEPPGNDPEPEPEPEPEGDAPRRPITDSQRRMMFRLFNTLDAFSEHPAHSIEGRAGRMNFINGMLGTAYASSNDLSVREAGHVIDALERAARTGVPS